MSVQLDTRSASAADTQAATTQGYWDYEPRADQVDHADLLAEPRANPSIDAENALSEVANRRRAIGDPVAIDGNDTNPQQRTQRTTPDGKPIQVDPLHSGAEVSIARERTIVDGRFVSSDQLVLTTGANNDDVQVTQAANGSLDVSVNGERYGVTLADGQELTIRTNAGNDTINVGPDVKVNVVAEGGDGDDVITTGAGDDRVDGGAGDDTITTNAGRDDVFGNTGNDRIDVGAGDDVVYGGDGDDSIAGGDGGDYLEGGKGADTIDGDGGQDVISGGLDDDILRSGAGDDRVYTGAGTDTVDNAAGADTVYAQPTTDTIGAADGARNTVVNVVLTGTPGTQGVRVEGSDAFRQRVEADIEMLRSSPNGRQMLAEFDAAAADGNTVTIRELANEQNGFAQTLGRGNAEITNGRAGEGSDVIISYNPSFHMAEFPAPVVVLYHEMSHAYNGVNGTFQPGTYSGPDAQDRNAGVPNAERQAVGLESSAPAFDFDGDPATPPTTHNPIELTENGLRTEFGMPLRLHYAL